MITQVEELTAHLERMETLLLLLLLLMLVIVVMMVTVVVVAWECVFVRAAHEVNMAKYLDCRDWHIVQMEVLH